MGGGSGEEWNRPAPGASFAVHGRVRQPTAHTAWFQMSRSPVMGYGRGWGGALGAPELNCFDSNLSRVSSSFSQTPPPPVIAAKNSPNPACSFYPLTCTLIH